MNFEPIETPFSPLEVQAMLGINEGRYKFLVATGLLKKSILNEHRSCYSFGHHNFFDIVEMAINIQAEHSGFFSTGKPWQELVDDAIDFLAYVYFEQGDLRMKESPDVVRAAYLAERTICLSGEPKGTKKSIERFFCQIFDIWHALHLYAVGIFLTGKDKKENGDSKFERFDFAIS